MREGGGILSLTLKYTLYVLLVFAAIFFVIFYILNMRTDVEMEKLASRIIANNVKNVSKILNVHLRFLPHIAVYSKDSTSIGWLKAQSMYFGGNVREISYTYEKENGKWYIKFSGVFETFRINKALVDLYGFFRHVISEQVKLGSGYFYVVDSLGNVIFHTIPERVGLNLVDEGFSDMMQTFLREKEGYVSYEYKGDTIKAFFKEANLPFELLYYDDQGNEHKIRFFLVDAITLSELRAKYAPYIKFMYVVMAPFMLIVVAIASYVIAFIGVKKIRNQSKIVRDFSRELYTNVSNLGTSAAEMEKIAENNTEIAKKLSEITHNFATSAEEGRYEIENSIKSIRSFLELLSKVNKEIGKAVGLIESLADLNERITYLSDTISVLAINASIESSKENIDREGIAKIVEHITLIAKEARDTSKQTRKTLDGIQKSLSQLALYSEKVKKEGTVIGSAIENIGKVIESFLEGVNQVRIASENLMQSSEETTAGVEEIASALNNLRTSMNKLTKMVENLKV